MRSYVASQWWVLVAGFSDIASGKDNHPSKGGSGTKLVQALRAGGATTKGGRAFTQCDVYRVLSNRTSLGEVMHKGRSHSGEDAAIVPQAMWDAAHALLTISPQRPLSAQPAVKQPRADVASAASCPVGNAGEHAALRVVVDAPCFDDPTRGSPAAAQVFVQAFVTEPAVNALDKPVLLRLARRDGVPRHPGRACHRSTALEVSFVPLSLTIIAGLPRSATIRSSSRTAAVPPPSARLRAPKGGPFCTPPRCQRNQR